MTLFFPLAKFGFQLLACPNRIFSAAIQAFQDDSCRIGFSCCRSRLPGRKVLDHLVSFVTFEAI